MTTATFSKRPATFFARPPRNGLSTFLQIATVAVALLLGAAFATSMFTDTAEEQLRAAVAPAQTQPVRS